MEKGKFKTEGKTLIDYRMKLESNVVGNQLILQDRQAVHFGLTLVNTGLLVFIIVLLFWFLRKR